MSRLEHSKILELENRTDVIAKDVQRLMDKRSAERITRVMFVWVEFHPQRIKIGQDEINRALEDGYEILWDYKYDNGVEFCLKKISEENIKGGA
jgi:predicted oxidoreductase